MKLVQQQEAKERAEVTGYYQPNSMLSNADGGFVDSRIAELEGKSDTSSASDWSDTEEFFRL